MDLTRPLTTITPTLDGDVLAILATTDATFTTGQLHRVLTQHSEEGIRKVVRRLTQQGVLLSERVGNAYAYRFNRDHLAAEHIIGLAQLRKTFVDRIEERLSSWEIAPVYAAVFGSAARGSMTVQSDVDLLLVRPDGIDSDRWETQVHELAADVTRWTGNDTRPLEFTAAEVESRGRDEPVLADVQREGLTVAGNRAWLTRQLREGNRSYADEAV